MLESAKEFSHLPGMGEAKNLRVEPMQALVGWQLSFSLGTPCVGSELVGGSGTSGGRKLSSPSPGPSDSAQDLTRRKTPPSPKALHFSILCSQTEMFNTSQRTGHFSSDPQGPKAHSRGAAVCATGWGTNSLGPAGLQLPRGSPSQAVPTSALTRSLCVQSCSGDDLWFPPRSLGLRL